MISSSTVAGFVVRLASSLGLVRASDDDRGQEGQRNANWECLFIIRILVRGQAEKSERGTRCEETKPQLLGVHGHHALSSCRSDRHLAQRETQRECRRVKIAGRFRTRPSVG